MRYAGLLVGPAAWCALSMFGALVMAVATGLRGTDILSNYANLSVVTTSLGFLIWIAVPWFRSPEARSRGPFNAAIDTLRDRWLMMIIPLAIIPIFMTSFTVMKTAVPLMTGYHFDGLWTNADALVFGTDPWRITHGLFGSGGSAFLSLVYTTGWGLVFALVTPIYALSGNPARVTRAFSALLATWLVGGVAGTALFSSVGPVFVDLVDPSLVSRFAPLHASLAELLPEDGAILFSQEYLRQSVGIQKVFHAGGISAMPSMHLGVCAWLVLLSGASLWRFPALVLWLLIWIGSVHFGYHYAVDGLVGSLIAWGCWKVCMLRSIRGPARVRSAMVPA